MLLDIIGRDRITVGGRYDSLGTGFVLPEREAEPGRNCDTGNKRSSKRFEVHEQNLQG